MATLPSFHEELQRLTSLVASLAAQLASKDAELQSLRSTHDDKNSECKLPPLSKDKRDKVTPKETAKILPTPKAAAKGKGKTRPLAEASAPAEASPADSAASLVDVIKNCKTESAAIFFVCC